MRYETGVHVMGFHDTRAAALARTREPRPELVGLRFDRSLRALVGALLGKKDDLAARAGRHHRRVGLRRVG